MQSPIPFIPEDTNNSHFNSLSPLLTPPLPPATASGGGKRRPPAPPGFNFSPLEESQTKLPACGGGNTMTIFGGMPNRGAHLAGAGHAAGRRATTAIASPQMYLDSSLIPPSSASPAASRESRPQYYEGPPPMDRRSSFDHGEARRTGGFNSRRGSDAVCPPSRGGSEPHLCPQSRGGLGADPHQNLEDENRYLREELSRLQNSAIDQLHRRPMAAIAGGGFRGPTSTTKQCMCDSLRSKLVKIRQELREAQGNQRFHSKESCAPPVEVVDDEAQTSPKFPPKEMPTYWPPQTAPSTFSGAAHTLAAAVDKQQKCLTDTPSQTDSKDTVEAGMQAMWEVGHCEVQTFFAKGELGTQAGNGITVPATVETQTAAGPRLHDTMSQTAAAEACDAEIQAVELPPAAVDASLQTEEIEAVAGSEVAVQCCAAATVAASQTDAAAAGVDAACEANIVLEPKGGRRVCAAASQTVAPARSVAVVQTVTAKRTHMAAQTVAPPPGVDHACQVDDDRLEAAQKREAERDARILELEAALEKLRAENEQLAVQTEKTQAAAEAFQHMAQTKAFGQMNVTILCPRAECTVSGERIEMDSWNPARLREEFEREVLPRFTRVFVEESLPGTAKISNSSQKARSEAVDKAMADFAETFRERLSAMLSAPNAAAAVQAAAATKGSKTPSR